MSIELLSLFIIVVTVINLFDYKQKVNFYVICFSPINKISEDIHACFKKTQQDEIVYSLNSLYIHKQMIIKVKLINKQ